MPQQSIKLLMDYNQERLEEECDCDGTGNNPQNLPKEMAFLDLAETLAQHEQVMPSLPTLLEDTELNVAEKQMVFYLMFLGHDQVLQKETLRAHFTKDPVPFDLLPVLALLDMEKQQGMIRHLITCSAKAALQTLAAHLLANPGSDTWMLDFMDEQGHFHYEGGLFDQLAALSSIASIKERLNSRFETEQGGKKLALAKALLSAHHEDALNWLSEEEGLILDCCESFALFSAPDAYVQLELLTQTHLPLSEATLLDIADCLKWYGNPQSIDFLLWGTNHESVRVKHAFHTVLMAFFTPNDSVVFNGALLLQDEAVSLPDYATKMDLFWDGHTHYLKQMLVNQRYFQSDPFDISALFKAHTGGYLSYNEDENITFSQFVEYLSLWTGQRFYYDKNALRSKQCQQIGQIKSWLFEHRDSFDAEKWFLFGQNTERNHA